MSTVAFNNQSYTIEPQESVLQCLLRHEVDYPNSCQAGICQSCLIKVKDGEINPAWQAGLPETLKAQGYFLACLAKPETPLEVSTPESIECEVNAQIIDINSLNYNVMRVTLHVGNLKDWTPGQYLSLINPEGTIRSYSIANIPEQEGFIELHVKIYPHGSMGQWLANKATKHAEVKLRGPFGRCFYYNPEQLAFNMLLAGTGTGLAPLIAIIKSALSNKHQGIITLVHGGLADEDIYYKEELEMLSLLFPSFVYDPCVLQSQGRYPEASIEQRTLMHLNQPKETRVYVCGPKETTDKLKKQIFLAGVPSQAILSDVFL
ncbi:TPA: FAD-binding oxidoreductase [Legionella pneumophila]|uniref:FAD-binding oxidoreductase n=1 Tax=Legionella pneumophila TaxID=446 RepID=UPI0022437217|nr:FAD-binding oxidoreductase [Legionella pneumophila]MCW8405753.1 FAD-binding oxidoreductase [Legionella pneumophila]HEL9664697.1 2Fe-2S iron-sulfur cluster binding domain-containing protein [Legionella pneumophila]HEN4742290.1 2Fe-2S iron-sulfur cluster binding domain-containing protein [Legionella pneumophila]HEN5466553.1 2Fe-2S iron-sulfur cluster binding domain-containing protein [Legionella pneumophila]